MVAGIYPYAIGASVCGIIALLFYSSGVSLSGFSGKLGVGFRDRLDRADMTIKPEEFALLIVGIAVILWLAIVLLIHTTPLISAFILPVSFAISIMGGNFYLKFRGDRRINSFVTQLELVLRMLAGALRVGLGLRQAIILVTEEVPDPARREIMRVIGRTNLGLPIVDALDDLSKSMPTNEMQMFAKVVRVQQSTGGDLAKVLEKLAATIRDRRRVIRKMGALTAQGRFGAFIIGALPVLVGGFVVSTQPEMGGALMHTFPGHIALGIFVALEGLAIYSLSRILRFDV
jgi:tight adherence protein B